MSEERPSKKLKTLSKGSTLHRDISPPPLRRENGSGSSSSSSSSSANATPAATAKLTGESSSGEGATSNEAKETLLLPSPFRLTKIKGLPATENIDTVTLQDLIGDPLLKETWQINFMFEMDFIMEALDEDTRDQTKINVVHGSWKTEAPTRIAVEEAKKRIPNMNVIIAYLPDPFGTHHTKMMVNFRHDDTAQVVIHTANMIRFDWTNMTQAAWISPNLPLLSSAAAEKKSGIGYEFKTALLAYFDGYGRSKLKKLTDELKKFDFSSVRAIFIGHVPGKHPQSSAGINALFGWPKLKAVMRKVGAVKGGKESTVAMQVSSIATLGATDKWLKETLLPAFCPLMTASSAPKVAVLFPTAEDIRTSINGWISGSSCHMKSASTAASKQLTWLRQYLHRWGHDNSSTTASSSSSTPEPIVRSGRHKAAPHIKTYTHLTPATERGSPDVGWSLLSSANLSLQAWGAAPAADGTVRVQSYEAGVLIHPGLWADVVEPPAESTAATTSTSASISIKAVGKKDMPDYTSTDGSTVVRGDLDLLNTGRKFSKVVVGLRMPYDYPISKLKSDEAVWNADRDYGNLRDWTGSTTSDIWGR